jgi:hypothetical protein
MGAEDDWTQEVRARRVAPPPSEAPTRRERPTSTRRERPEVPTRPDAAEVPTRPDAAEAPTQRVRPRSIGSDDAPDPAGSVSARRTRPLNRREIQELDIAEPPTARLGRSAPAAPRTPEASEPTEPPPGPDPAEAETQRQPAHHPPPDPDDDQLTIRLDRPTHPR